MSLSKAKIKLIQALQSRKKRRELGLFVVEGEKQVKEVMQSTLKVQFVLYTEHFIFPVHTSCEEILVTEKELKEVSNLSTATMALAVVEIPSYHLHGEEFSNTFSFVLDRIQDPGNLGTIIRTADWFGLPYVFCSTQCADVWNSKCVQASMGSVFRVKVFYLDLQAFLQEVKAANPDFPIYAAALKGANVYKQDLGNKGFIILGNESQGIDEEILALADKKLFIPQFGEAESLNVAMSASIFAFKIRSTKA
jgi:TrmH family RNA methyltransferase